MPDRLPALGYDVKNRIRREASELVWRSTRSSGLFYLLALFGIVATDPLLYEQTLSISIWFISLLLLYIARFFSYRIRLPNDDSLPPMVFRIMIILGGLVWSCCIVWIMSQYDDVTGTSALAMVVAVVFLTGAVHTMYPVSSLMLQQLLALSLPIAIACPAMFGIAAGLPVSAMLIIYVLYLWRNGMTHHQLYWQNQIDNARLSQQGEELRQLADVRSRFLAQMSHEIRTPLNGVIGMTQLLESTQLEQEQRRLLTVIRQSGDVLLRLIDDILEITRLNEDKITVNATPVSVVALMSDLGELMRPSALSKNLSLNIQTDHAIPASVVLDGVRVQQVLLNFLSNAIKFTPSGQITLSAERVEGKAIRFSVEDTGIGIGEEDVKTVFDHFTQVENYHPDARGVGLGLAISAQLVRLMDGEIGVNSQPGVGSTFWAELPLLIPDQEGADSETVEQPSQVETPSERSLSILVVEDNLVNQEVIGTVLSSLGYPFEMVGDGMSAITAYIKQRPDVILMDCNLPVMDGFEAATKIRAYEHHHHLPTATIIALTAHVMPEVIGQCRGAGMNGHIAKPIQIPEVSAILERIAQLTAIPENLWIESPAANEHQRLH